MMPQEKWSGPETPESVFAFFPMNFAKERLGTGKMVG